MRILPPVFGRSKKNQCVGLTLSYSFNVSGSKYKGSGAGNDEKNRL
ncbi:MAG: hypothetical protein IJL82_00655 [Prevotella sp.]|nr:hypothetical protein [Prevotella sp.]